MPTHNDNISVDEGFDALDYSYTNSNAAECNIHIRGEHHLWCAVIYQALYDLGVKEESTEAQRWLFRNNKDFLLVCALAGMDPVTVRQAALKRIHGWHAAPGFAPRNLPCGVVV